MYDQILNGFFAINLSCSTMFLGTSRGEVAVVDLYEKRKDKIGKKIRLHNSDISVPFVIYSRKTENIFAADFKGNVYKISTRI